MLLRRHRGPLHGGVNLGYSMFVSGITHLDEKRAFPGYTVYATLSGDGFNLIDLYGNVVHSWPVPAGTKAYYGFLLPTGNLLGGCANGTEHSIGGASAVTVEMDWDGNQVMRYEDSSLHHDRCRLQNGNTIVISHEELDPAFAARVKGGSRVESANDIPMIGEQLLEVTNAGETVWEWHAHEHLDPEVDAIFGLGRREWLHCNAVEELPDGRILMSYNATSRLVLIDKESGKLIWRLNEGVTMTQHNPTWLPDSQRILVFDNGSNRRLYSRVIEIEPESQQVKWEYAGSPKDSFHSPNISGAQRLPNGNTLVCEGRPGRLFEVTSDGDVVWEFVNPREALHGGEPRSRSVFRAYRYAADSSEIRNRV
jgi:hypothetical protein